MIRRAETSFHVFYVLVFYVKKLLVAQHIGALERRSGHPSSAVSVLVVVIRSGHPSSAVSVLRKSSCQTQTSGGKQSSNVSFLPIR